MRLVAGQLHERVDILRGEGTVRTQGKHGDAPGESLVDETAIHIDASGELTVHGRVDVAVGEHLREGLNGA